MSWQQEVIQSLLHAAHRDGGWGYRPGSTPAGEPTALACLALTAHRAHPRTVDAALHRLAAWQRRDGGVPASSTLDAPCWTTALAVLAWSESGQDARGLFSDNLERAGQWLIKDKGRALPLDPERFGHDTRLVGWPWVAGTHSWVEPTAYAVAAMTRLGRSDHRRVREAVRLLLDRALPGGGWNYGNTRVLRHTLRPFPATTGAALAALVGKTNDERIGRSVDELTSSLPRLRAPFSLAWGLIGLQAWIARPRDGDAWLARSAERSLRSEPRILDEALLLLADARWRPASGKTE